MNEELDIAAAEYVLGTLPADERARLAIRLRTEPELRDAVLWWQARFAPLDDTAEAQIPPAAVWQAIERATAGGTVSVTAPATAAEAPSNVVYLRRRLALWRGGALVTGALAAGLAGILVLDRSSVAPERAGERYVAVVDTGGREPALIAEVDTGTGIIHVRSVTAEIPSGRSLELWHVAENHPPRSLGILQAGGAAQRIQDAASTRPLEGVIAVTVEPEGGSPSGAPTGEIVYSGRLIPVE
jgi:anti-sigma-K factor RskA